MKVWIEPSDVSGTLRIPPSKSYGHRALICAGLAQGTSTIHHLGNSKDMDATLSCLTSLGAHVSLLDASSADGTRTIQVTGCSPKAIPESQPVTLNANESGSTLRFFIPIAAAGSEPVTFLGKPTLLSRPMGVYANIFAEQNLAFEQSGTGISFQGPLQGGLFKIDGNVSSQFISGLLMAAPFLGRSDLAILPPYQSKSYVDLTVEMMKRFGVAVDQPTEHAYIVNEGQHYTPAVVDIESDWSQAAFFLVLGMLNAPLILQGLNPDSLQGDKVIMDAIELAGGKLQWEEDGLMVKPGLRKAFDFDLADCPDLGPILCVLAAMCDGTSTLRHAARLRYKECDRIAAMEDELRKWGVDIESTEDEIIIHGKTSWKQEEPVIIDSHNDHRVVMAMAVFGLCAQSATQILDAQAVTKSYPHFFDDLLEIKGKVVRA